MTNWGASFNDRNKASHWASPAYPRGAHFLLSKQHRRTELRIVAVLPLNPQMFDMAFDPRKTRRLCTAVI